MLYYPTFNDITFTTERLAIYLCFIGDINPYKLLYYLEIMANR